MSGPRIKLSSVTVAPSRLSDPVLGGCDEVIEAGEFVAIMGASGCGKTTLLRGLAGFLAPSAGKITWGREQQGLEPDPQNIGFVFQDAKHGIFPWKSVRANLAFPCQLRCRPPDPAITVESLGLAKSAQRLPGTLSGGERKRLLLGMAISYQPDLLILDEPMAGLDFDVAVHMLAMLADFHRRMKATIVMVTHNPLEAAIVASRVLCLHDRLLSELARNTSHTTRSDASPFDRVRDPRTTAFQEQILREFTERVAPSAPPQLA